NYMIDLFQGDMGTSYRTGGSVISEIGERFPVTLLLAVLDIFLTAVISIPLGVYIAIKKNSIADNVLTIVALIFTAMPSFWLGMLLMLVFAVGLNILPATGSDSFACFILPAFTVALLSVAQIMRMTRSSMLETLRSDYMRTARAKGVKENKIIWKHAIRNALLPVVTTMGVNFGWALGGSVITETVFGMSGVGTLTLLSVRSKDVPLVMGCVLFMSLLFSLITLVVDISYAYIDPRIKAQYGFKSKSRKSKRKEIRHVQSQS
ncbi:MAG: ABC transporter permease, partial [Emergencia timonensis]